MDTILIIDDNPDDRELYKRLLGKDSLREIDFLEAQNAQEGFNLLCTKNIGCVLLDYHLPDMSGLDLLKQIHEYQKNKNKIPIIMLTGQGNEQVAVSVMKLGAIDYVIKENLTPRGMQRAVFNGIEKVCLENRLQLQTESLQTANKNFEIVNEKLIQASQAKSDFLARMSHELRTPLNSVLGVSDLILEETRNPTVIKYVHIQQRSGEVLLSIINDILDISKIEERQFELEVVDFDVNEVVTSCMDIMRYRSDKKGLSCELELSDSVPSYVQGDANRLKQVIINLIGNAINFTESGTIKLKISIEENTDAHCSLLFSVSDTGIGIAKENLDRIFQRFEQSHSAIGHQYGGTGLGLSICKSLVELMHGKIWVKSILGEGSSFFFTVKLGLSKKTRSQIKHTSSMTLLLVEDEEELHQIIRSNLEAHNLHIISAYNGLDALTILKTTQVDAVLADIAMPTLDGIELYNNLRKMKLNIPFIFISGNYTSEEVVKALKVSDVRVFSKPTINEEFFNEAVMQAVKTGFDTRHLRKLPQKAQSLQSLQILLAEDAEVNIELIQLYMQSTPFTVDVAENGLICYNKFKSKNYDLVLMDMQMPVLDGSEATRKIRLYELENNLAPTPIVALTAFATTGIFQDS